MTEPRIVFFSSITEATRRFVEKLPWEAERIPLRGRDAFLEVDYDYILVLPTYGAGKPSGAVPKQVVKFLKPLKHRQHCVGIIAGGNKNFGTHNFVFAGRFLEEKLGVPMLYAFEVAGTDEDVKAVTAKLGPWWKQREESRSNQSDSQEQ